MSMDTDRCVKCSGETHDVDGLGHCISCRPRVSFSVQTVGDRQYGAVYLDGFKEPAYRSVIVEQAKEVMRQIEQHGGPECPFCDEAMLMVDPLLFACQNEECSRYGEEDTIALHVDAYETEVERQGMRAMERDLASAHGGESQSYREAMTAAGRSRLLR